MIPFKCLQTLENVTGLLLKGKFEDGSIAFSGITASLPVFCGDIFKNLDQRSIKESFPNKYCCYFFITNLLFCQKLCVLRRFQLSVQEFDHFQFVGVTGIKFVPLFCAKKGTDMLKAIELII